MKTRYNDDVVDTSFSRSVSSVIIVHQMRIYFDHDLINVPKELKTKVWKRFKLSETKEAIQAVFAKERDGRILLDVA
jgi:S-adenosylhomocysteine hydrolase